jgi:hypothetical protein
MRSARPARFLVFAGIVAIPLAILTAPILAAKPAAGLKNVKAGAPADKGTLTAARSNAPPAIHGESPAHRSRGPVDPMQVAAQVDELIASELKKTNAEVAPRCSDEDFLRRVSFDIAGVSPSPQDVTLFGLDPDSNKRAATIDRLLASAEYAQNWSRYWHDVLKTHATETRLQFLFPSLQAFEAWMKSQLAANRPWDEIATALVTATGDSIEDGRTGLIVAQQANPAEIAAESSRIFLGIQIQCANCHDHPTDSWKREQFHGLAAFFPRIQLNQKRAGAMVVSLEVASLNMDAGGRGQGRGNFQQLREHPEQFISRLDTNGDGKISREEAKRAPNGGQGLEYLFAQGDADHDGFLTAAEIKKVPPPPMQPGRGSAEYHMPDLQHPQSDGKKIDPVFFLGNLKPGAGLGDLDRRRHLARYFTSPENPWFAKAFVNRIWGQLVGEGFYMPIDDIGPDRNATYPEALDTLSSGFTSSGYDVAWLFRAIANTETYQRQIRARDPKKPVGAFASAAPVRLRADHLFDALIRVLGIKEEEMQPQQRPEMMAMARRFGNTPRGRFDALFGFDPSTSPDELTGTIPQALFMMNSGFVNSLIRAGGKTRLNQILDKFKDDEDAVNELFLVVHAREPSPKEMQVCRDYIRQVNNRQEAFEDLLWSLLNSTEFQTKR